MGPTLSGASRRWLIAGGVLVAAVLVAVMLFRRSGQPPSPAEGFDLSAGFHMASVPGEEGSDPGLGIRKLWVVRRGGRTAWDYHILCVDPAGCVGRVELTFRFRAGGRSYTHTVVREVSLGRGATRHDAFTMTPGLEVDAVDGVRIRFLERLETPRPTPTRTM